MRQKETYENLEIKVKRLESELKEYRENAENPMPVLSENFKRIADRSRDGIYHFDLATRSYLYFNKSSLDLYGLEEDGVKEMTTKSVILHIHPEDRNKVKKAAAASIAPGSQVDEVRYRFLHRDGSIRWMHDRWSVMRDSSGRAIAIEGFIRDDTERKQAEEELRKHRDHLEEMVAERTGDLVKRNEELQQEIAVRRRTEEALRRSEERFRSLVETAPIVIIHLSPDGRIIEFNPEAERLYGRKRDEAIGQNYLEFCIPEDIRQSVANDIKKVLAGEPTRGYENPIRDAVRNERLFIWNADCLLDNQGKASGIIAVGQDITERRRAEEKLKRYQENLEYLVEERTRELKDAQKELVKKAMEAGRAQLSAMVLHNIGNAMTPVRVHVEGMKSDELEQIAGYLDRSYMDLCAHVKDLRRYVNDDPRGKEVFSFMGKLVDTLKDHTDQTRKAVGDIDRAVSYISDILTLQQSYAARESETKERVDLNRVLEDAVRMQAGTLEKRGIVVKKDLETGLPNLLVDKGRLIQMVVNLIKNSYEALDQVADQNQEQRIIFKSFHDGGHVGFEISDTGEGIAPDELASICEFGYSLKGSSGFGLYYCKSFVEASNGTLTVSSPGKGKGTTVRIAFKIEN